jgi:hypothetical protein
MVCGVEMTARTHALLASLASGCPDWHRTYERAVKGEGEHHEESARLFGFSSSERAWFRAPLTQQEASCK